MKTMNRWFLAGLIGLSSAAVSLGSIMLDDFNTDNSAYVTYGNNLTSGNLYVQAGNRNLSQPEVGITIANGQALIHYERLAYPSGTSLSGRIGEGKAIISYTANEGDYTGYTGITLNFGANMPDFLALTWTAYSISQLTGFMLEVTTTDWGKLYTDVANDQYGVYGTQPMVSWTPNQDYTFAFDSTAWADATGSYTDPIGFESYIVDASKITGIRLIFDTGLVYTRSATSSDNNNGILLNYIQLEGGPVSGVPEPETVWMIVAVLASLAVTFRRQLIGMVSKA